MHFDAGMRELQSAQHSELAEERTNQLRAARANFNAAVGLEKSYRLALAWLGLACCHDWLGDKKNSEKALREILKINPLAHVSAVHIVRGQVLDEVKSADTLPLAGEFIFLIVLLFVVAFICVLLGIFTNNYWLLPWLTSDVPGFLLYVAVFFSGAVVWRVSSRWATASRRRAVYIEGLRRALSSGGDIEKLAQVQNLVAAHLNEVVPWVQAMGEKEVFS